jgi:hypothetical protein
VSGLLLLIILGMSKQDNHLFAGESQSLKPIIAPSPIKVAITGRNLIDVAGLQFQVVYLSEYGDLIGVTLHPSLEREVTRAPELGYSLSTGALDVVFSSPISLPVTSGLLNLEFSVPDDICRERYVKIGSVQAFNIRGEELSDDQGKLPVLTMAGDVNQDGFVTTEDLRVISNNFGQPDPDLNADNVVDIVDLTIVARNFGRTCG